MERCRKSRTPLSLADLEFMRNDVHEAVELGHKARFLWLSADERADNLGRLLFDARAELARVRVEVLREVYDAIEDPDQRKAVGGGLGWETARDVVHNLLRKASGGAA